MPKILIYKAFIFIIFSVDINESRRHIHIVKKSVKKFYPAKFWLEPKIEMANKGDFTDKEINKIHDLIDLYFQDINNQLDAFFNGNKINIIKK